MKKATNSKSRGKISKLFQITQEHFGKSMNPARIKLIKLITLLLKSPVKPQTVNLVRLTNAMPPTDSHDASAISLTGYWNGKALPLKE